MLKYLFLPFSILFTLQAWSAESETYFCSNTSKPPTLRIITVSGGTATIEMEGEKPQYNVLENRPDLLVLGRVMGFGENQSKYDGYYLLVLDKRNMIMQAVTTQTDKPYVETKSSCIGRN